MDKTYRDEYQRLFLIEHLPEPMTRADAHLQLFDNYVENTRLRLRSVRVPETKQWTWILQQRYPVSEDLMHWKTAEIHLDEIEHQTFETFEGSEIRKNRHFFELDGREIEIDLYLGTLWGLNVARIAFDSPEALAAFEPAPFMALEVTGEPFFLGRNLVGKTFAAVQAEIARILAHTHSRDTIERETAKDNE
jgi:CYTH domain-containing protein